MPSDASPAERKAKAVCAALYRRPAERRACEVGAEAGISACLKAVGRGPGIAGRSSVRHKRKR